MAIYAISIFLSAFLLFEVQPIIAKAILPWFGGTSAVWSTCMLFFQLTLLLGYLYAHWLHRALAPRAQALLHSAALALSLAALPILPNPWWKDHAAMQPSLRILLLLAATVGLPYFLLSSTTPLLQAWYSRNHKDGLPYRLFALSNFASMLALLSYPFLIEPNVSTRLQGWGWSALYAGFAVFCGAVAWRSAAQGATATLHPKSLWRMGGINNLDGSHRHSVATEASPPRFHRLLWLALAASASVLLLTVTNHLTQDVAAIPFLWIMPLSLYLLSFIICFEALYLYRRVVFMPLLVLALGFMAYRLSTLRTWMSMQASVVLFGLALFVCCMVCHGELARLKPHPRLLTSFYLTVSLGGALGGVFVGLIAPMVFRAYYEFPLGLALCAATVCAVWLPRLWDWSDSSRAVASVALSAALAGYLWFLGSVMHDMTNGYLVVARNFYGQLRVMDDGDASTDENAVRKFIHGVINHGEQSLDANFRRLPITYFCENSGIGRAMRAKSGGPRRIGILGLGCGTLAAYGRAGDTIRIYEINPLVLDIARSQFTYLRDTPARTEVALGDGRLVLEAERSQSFDLLVMDAFSGDSVPVHLITVEAFRTYFRHLKPDGILAVNISNKYLNLEPVIQSGAAALGKVAFLYHYQPPDADFLCFSCSWTLVMDRATGEAYPGLRAGGTRLMPERPFRAWTDDFSNLYAILK
jgi:hypothetical protein